jgi:hypothetical protein
LVEHSHSHTTTADDLTGVGFHPLCQEANQAGLALAISSHHANAVTVIDSNGERAENDFGGVFEVEIICSE